MEANRLFGAEDPYIKFHGAIDNEVTGSMHIYKTYVDGKPFRICLDAGAEQGIGITPLDNKTTGLTTLPDVVLMTHSHLDHCGKLPLLYKEGFRGKVYGTEATLKGISVTLADSLTIAQKISNTLYNQTKNRLKTDLRKKWKYIQDHGADIKSGKHLYDPLIPEQITKLFGNKKRIQGTHYNIDDFLDPHERYLQYNYDLKKYGITRVADIDNLDLNNQELAFDNSHIQGISNQFTPLGFEQEIVLKEGKDNRITIILIPAGHILGSAQIMIKDALYGNTRFTGDLGRIREPMYAQPPVLPGNTYGKIHTLITESTYGGKIHPNRTPEQQLIIKLIEQTKGNILIPVFSNDRSQKFQKFLTDTQENRQTLAKLLLLDGYTSRRFNQIFQNYGGETYDTLNSSVFTWAIGKSEEKVSRYLKPGKKAIVVTSSGMMNGGAVETYMHAILSDSNGLLLLTGYQAAGSRGEQILKTNKYTYAGVTHQVKCKIYQCKTWSSHADHNELLELIGSAHPNLTYLVHGDRQAKTILQQAILERDISKEVCIPTVKGLKHPLGK